MPSREEILAGLSWATNEAFLLSVAWHLLIVAGAFAVALGWRPSRRLAAMLLSAPLVSAGVVALGVGNPFNSLVLSVLAVVLVLLTATAEAPVARGARWSAAIGIAMMAFGYVYPHFLERGSVLAYFVGAPVGVLPCPTLSLVIGAGLVSGGLGRRAWSTVLAVAGLFYGVFGVLRLGVILDVVLAAGAVALLLATYLPTPHHVRRSSSHVQTFRRFGDSY